MGELVTSGSMPEIPSSSNGKDYYYLVDGSGNGVFGAILNSDASIDDNGGCYFSDPDIGCSSSYATEYDRDTLVLESDNCSSGTCGGVSAGDGVATAESCFTFSSGTITDYDETNCSLDVVIPSTIGGESVTSIGSYAFKYIQLSSVSIPDSVTVIYYNAFRNSNLTSVYIPDNVGGIGFDAFSGNPLDSVSINSNTSYDDSSFGTDCTEANGCLTVRP